MTLRHLPALLALTALFGLGGALTACSENIRFKNVVPAMGSLGPVVPPEDGVSTLWLSIVDYDRDPVDVALEIQLDGGPWAPLEEAAGPGHGTIGLTADPAFPGRVHFVLWDTAGIDADAEIRVRATPDDRQGGVGSPLETPSFSLGSGLSDPALP
jgi:hypothetical protein